MTATLTERRTRADSAPPTFDLDAARVSSARRRGPEIAAGLLIVVVCALGALWWQSSTTQRHEVLAIRTSIERGHVITVNDLQLVGVTTDDNLAVLTEADASSIVGRVARTDLTAGTLATRDLFSSSSLIGSGDGVVGLSLEAGQFPSLRMAAGDVVSVILTPASNDRVDATAPANVIVARATVVEVEAVGVQGRMFIAVQVGEADAARVATAASANRVRLIQVAEG